MLFTEEGKKEQAPNKNIRSPSLEKLRIFFSAVVYACLVTLTLQV